jgi:dTDP-4-dehydrorhamnose 3,5-epimerase
MELKSLSMIGPFIAHSTVHVDNRGDFLEWFKLKDLQAATGSDINFTQGNISRSHAKVLRGIHYSISPAGQSKWVTCIRGRILDYIIDLRVDSPTFKQWEEIEIKGMQGVAVFIPQGFGHAFLSMEDDSLVTYLVSSDFDPMAEKAINPFDQEISLKFPLKDLVISDKDSNALSLKAQLANGMLPRETQY